MRRRAVELGNAGAAAGVGELEALLKSPAPMVRRAAASALGKLISRDSGLSAMLVGSLAAAAERESHPQVLQYLMKAMRLCAKDMMVFHLDILRDVARNPGFPAYVRDAANEAVAAGDAAAKERESRLKHWCARCHKVVTEEESRQGIDKYGKPYCFHCLEEKIHEDELFVVNVEAAKKLRTVDEVAVQSKGERRIGDWLAKKGIAYRYDERMIIAGDTRIRPDFYLPEFDLYIEYWGMNTPEYLANMKKKQFLYQRERKKLISLSYRDFDRLEQLLQEKLSRYVPSL